MEKQKIIQIIPTLELAGAEVMVENLSTSLIENGYDVVIISLYNIKSSITERLENKKIRVYYLGKKKGLDIRMIHRLYKVFQEEMPNVVHTHLYVMKYAIPAAILSKIPIRVHTVHTIANKEVNKLNRKINNFFYRLCNVIPVSITPAVKRSVIEEYKLTEKQVPMIYNGIDLSKCDPKKDYSINGDKIVILHIGRFSEAKNHIGIIESFKIVHDKEPNVVLQLIGTGELESTVKNKVVELKLQDSVEFLGLQSDVYPFLNSADIFILPSLWEGMPMTLIEAMGTGLPIVSTKVGGIPDMIENNLSGILVENDIVEISEAIIKLINEEELRKNIGSEAKRRSEQFSSKNMAEKYERIYNEL